MKHWVKQIPLVGSLAVSLSAYQKKASDQRVRKRLSRTPYPQGEEIEKAVSIRKPQLPPSEQARIARIECERERLLQRDDPLVDGSLGPGGIYDQDVTIRAACQVSKSPEQALMLYCLIRRLKPRTVIELGTNVGISSAFIAAAIAEDGQQGELTTLDSSPYRQRLAREVHRNLGLDGIRYVAGLFTDTLSDSLGAMSPIDLAFIDGHHQYQPTLDYLEEILRAASPKALFVFDDIRWSDGMKQAWSELKADTRFGLVVDLYSVGICLRAPNESSRRYVFPPLYNAFG